MHRWLTGLVLTALLHSLPLSVAAQDNGRQVVELELVLAVDASTSVNSDEYKLQRSGIAEAFRHPKVLAAIDGLGEEGLAVSVVQWSGPNKQRVAVDWSHVNSRASAFQLATAIDAMPRLMTGFTDIAGAINYSTAEIENNRFTGRRLAIDVSGDGTSDRNDPALARDQAILKGITINGLVIHSIEYDLGDLARFDLRTHYRDRVIGGPGAFLLNAESFKTFAVSMREKLYREISGPLFASRF
ncbi:MAG: DUF1194 domain-containing protein [Rhizobiaceae bacterium]